jgi:hypothetical protein
MAVRMSGTTRMCASARGLILVSRDANHVNEVPSRIRFATGRPIPDGFWLAACGAVECERDRNDRGFHEMTKSHGNLGVEVCGTRTGNIRSGSMAPSSHAQVTCQASGLPEALRDQRNLRRAR